MSSDNKIEPPRDETNKMICAPSGDSEFSLGIRPVWSESPLCAQWVAKDWADAQANLSLRWASNHFIGFVMRRLKRTRDVTQVLNWYSCVTFELLKSVYYFHEKLWQTDMTFS